MWYERASPQHNDPPSRAWSRPGCGIAPNTHRTLRELGSFDLRATAECAFLPPHAWCLCWCQTMLRARCHSQLHGLLVWLLFWFFQPSHFALLHSCSSRVPSRALPFFVSPSLPAVLAARAVQREALEAAAAAGAEVVARGEDALASEPLTKAQRKRLEKQRRAEEAAAKAAEKRTAAKAAGAEASGRRVPMKSEEELEEEEDERREREAAKKAGKAKKTAGEDEAASGGEEEGEGEDEEGLEGKGRRGKEGRFGQNAGRIAMSSEEGQSTRITSGCAWRSLGYPSSYRGP